MKHQVRRLVTGSDPQGRSYLLQDATAPVKPVKGLPGLVFHELWRTAHAPSPVAALADPAAPLRLTPEPGGTVIRICDIPPDAAHHQPGADIDAHFAEMGLSKSGAPVDADPHALMHQTRTVDYGILLEGEVWLVLDDGETRLSPGDVVIQRGTRHAWSNRTECPARMAFVLVDARAD
ncbi:cupin domain-containing protein [Paraburkholderia sp.]|uniref:cupin domain-containing protein n=1 Tax=Paraburkholderia sp. TaxID=1926495 RepID=UPI0039E34418